MNGQQEEVESNFAKFKELLPALLDRSGKYALLRHGSLIEIYDTFEDALKTANAFYEDRLFSIQKITNKPIDLGLRSRALHNRKI